MANKLTTGLVGHWKLDEGTGTSAADSAGSNTGTLVNTPTWDTNVPSVRFTNPYCLTFNGSDEYVTVPHNSNYNFSGGRFTIAGWLKRSSITNRIEYLVSKRNESTDTAFWNTYIDSSNKISIFIQSSVGNNISVLSTGTITDTNWHHFAFAYNGLGTGTVYLDASSAGTQTSAGTLSGNSFDNSTGIYFGWALNGVSTRKTTGSLDDVRIYNRALTQAEITELAAGSDKLYQSFEINAQHVYYKFDEGSGTTVRDYAGAGTGTLPTGVGATGTLVGSPSYSTDVPPVIKFNNPYSLLLNGSSQYVDIGDCNSFTQATNDFTISVWIKPTVETTYRTIVDKRNVLSAAGFLLGLDNAHKINMYIADGSNTANALSTTLINKNIWYHIVGVVRRGATNKIFINGVEDASASNTTVANTLFVASDARVGFRSITTSVWSYFDGKMDDFRIWKRALSADEIALLAAGNRTASVLYSGEWHGATLS
jgi:hypothetical protein